MEEKTYEMMKKTTKKKKRRKKEKKKKKKEKKKTTAKKVEKTKKSAAGPMISEVESVALAQWILKLEDSLKTSIPDIYHL
ncbi:hypothetical protein M8J77_007859 [Diaphorina citri]|nr:hypothetical protein M8J77_007859 [Diaphorina citri]